MLLRLLKNIFRSPPSATSVWTPQQGDFLSSQITGEHTSKVLLNVGGNNKTILLPEPYRHWKQLLLDIDPKGNPDIVCDARSLHQLPSARIDVIYCSHNLEHFYRHDVAKVLSGFWHVLKDDGFVHIRVPNIGAVMQTVVARDLDIDDLLYESASGPIHVIDVIYGWGLEIERSGNDFFAHKTGFTEKSLVKALNSSGFPLVRTKKVNLEIVAFGFKNEPEFETIQLIDRLFEAPQFEAT